MQNKYREIDTKLLIILPLSTLYVDGASNNDGSGADIMLISPEGHKMHCAICFGFKASNNEVECEALIAGLCLVC